MSKKVAVIGAGPSGLLAAQVLSHKDFFPSLPLSVTLFEAHSKPGGCASYFRRKLDDKNQVVFDAGATLLNTVGEHGFLRGLVTRLGNSNLIFEDNKQGYFSFGEEGHNRKLIFSNLGDFTHSLCQNFPQDASWIKKELPRLFEDVQQLRDFLERRPIWPLQNALDLFSNLKKLQSEDRKLLHLLPLANKNFQDWLDSKKASPNFLRFVNMLCLITLQCRANQVYVPWGLFALFFYPLGSGVCQGGMKEYFETQLETLKNRCQVRMREKVTGLQLKSGLWNLSTNLGRKESFDFVFSSLPRFNTEELLQSKISPNHLEFESLKPDLWSALVGYFVVKDHPSLDAEAFNLHISPKNKKDVYYSFSSRNNLKRAPSAFRTITASTHWSLNESFPDNEYEAFKEQMGEKFLLEPLVESLPSLEFVFKEYGSPKTFEHYTHRCEGSVGGIPLSQKYTWFGAGSWRTPYPSLFQIGDTSFPGQSVYATSLGAIAAIEDAFKLRLPF